MAGAGKKLLAIMKELKKIGFKINEIETIDDREKNKVITDLQPFIFLKEDYGDHIVPEHNEIGRVFGMRVILSERLPQDVLIRMTDRDRGDCCYCRTCKQRLWWNTTYKKWECINVTCGIVD